jgi:hypothetical protein
MDRITKLPFKNQERQLATSTGVKDSSAYTALAEKYVIALTAPNTHTSCV